MTIEEQVNDGIKNAMKAHDKVRLETMRNIKKVILEADRKSTRLNSSHVKRSRMPSSA